MNADVKEEVKLEIKTEPVDVITSLKDETSDDDEYVVPPKRLRRNQGAKCCAIIRIIKVYCLQKCRWLEIVHFLIPLTGWLLFHQMVNEINIFYIT